MWKTEDFGGIDSQDTLGCYEDHRYEGTVRRVNLRDPSTIAAGARKVSGILMFSIVGAALAGFALITLVCVIAARHAR